ncbi:MAG TPA: extracellular solute-binding protein, partial [Sphaerochaeta sp.]|nr:extracellular solute-binding protein [Sphaerochaeta sp.]
MNKKTLFFAVLLLLLVLLPLTAQGAKAPSAVTLTMGSWRADDVEQMNRVLAEYKKVAPDVTIRFQPTNPPDYNATLRLQLDSGTGPDLMYARSYAAGE